MPTETSDAAGDTSTAYSLANGQFFVGQIGSGGDTDWVRITLVAGQTYSFAMVGLGPASTALQDTYLNLLDADGNLITYSDEEGPAHFSGLTFTATTSGTYYLEAEAYDLIAATGSYALSMTTSAKPTYSIEMIAGDILSPYVSWSTPPDPVTVTWSARSTFSGITDAQGNPTTFSKLDGAEIAAVQSCLQNYADVAGIAFTQVNPGGTSNSATLRFSNYYSTTDGAGAFAFYPGDASGGSIDGDVQLNTDSINSANMKPGSYSYWAALHEIGHTLGLAHPGDYNAAPGVAITYENNAQFIQDSQQYTVMSYFDESETGAVFLGGGYAQTLMMADIYAIQQLYGVNTSIRSDNTVYGFHSSLAGSVYDFSSNATPNLCIWDGAGTDTLDVSGFTMAQRIDLNAGHFSNIGGGKSNVSIAIGTSIERATGGSGSDQIYGSSGTNTLSGGLGSDSLNGGAGKDLLIGGAGKDQLTGGTGMDYFRFDQALGSTNIDTITDFSHADDTIQLENAVFKALGLTTGALSSSMFRAVTSGHAASNTSQHIIYDKSNGTLWYDDDGNKAGGHVAIQFAQLGTSALHPTDLNYTDFFIV